ncbi:MAG: DUF2059 domain-containing protein [Pseudomonadota bacterium]
MRISGILAVILAVAIGLTCVAGPATAQESVEPGMEASAVSPERRAAAAAMLEALFPVDDRSAFMRSMIAPTLQNITAGLAQDPQIAQALQNNEEMAELVATFITDVENAALAQTEADLPAMFQAMETAYARALTIPEMEAAAVFFESDAGRTYMQKAPLVMADPDVAAWQQKSLATSLEAMQPLLVEFTEKMKALRAQTTAE